MYQNAMIYNKPHTVYFKTAQFLLKETEDLFRAIKLFMKKTTFHHGSKGFLDIPSGLFDRSSTTLLLKNHHSMTKSLIKPKSGSRTVKKKKTLSSSLDDDDDDAANQNHSNYASIPDLLKNRKKLHTFHEGDLVWAKIIGFPWYPSQVMNPNMESSTTLHSIIPIHPLSKLKEYHHHPPPNRRISTSHQQDYLLVMFFDRPEGKRTYAWLSQSEVFPLGENLNFDKLFLNYSKKNHQRKAIRHAYSQALKKNKT